MSVIAFYQGEFVDPVGERVPIEERGHQFGDGVYEVVRVYGGRPFLLDEHLERLERSLRTIGIRNPYTADQWTALIGEAIRRSGEAEAQVYWQVTRGAAERVHTFPAAEPAVSLVVRPVAAKPASADAELLGLPDDRWANVFVKSVNLLPNVLAKETARRAGAAEAMLVRNGRITEGASSNVWLVRGNTLWTAPADRYILGGITRLFTLRLAQELGIPVREEAVTLDQLDQVDEVFITSTTLEIQPVRAVFTDRALLPALRQLPDAAPDTLLPEVRERVPLWSAARPPEITARLQEAYQTAVERFRNHEPILTRA
ncbi:MAG: aminotransferase class IV [Alicyclobacillus sp.]|nr:aminotransferase class IV [Alicyclobacillus sp.]